MSTLSHKKKGINIRSYYTRAKVFGFMLLGILIIAILYKIFLYFN